MLGVDFDWILSPALLSCAVKAWSEINQKQITGDGEIWEGMGRKNKP